MSKVPRTKDLFSFHLQLHSKVICAPVWLLERLVFYQHRHVLIKCPQLHLWSFSRALTENGTKGTNIQRGAEAMTGSAVCEAFLNLKSHQFIPPWEITPEGPLNKVHIKAPWIVSNHIGAQKYFQGSRRELGDSKAVSGANRRRFHHATNENTSQIIKPEIAGVFMLL